MADCSKAFEYLPEKIGKLMKYILPGILILAVVFVGIDKINDFHYLSRWKEDTPKTK